MLTVDCRIHSRRIDQANPLPVIFRASEIQSNIYRPVPLKCFNVSLFCVITKTGRIEMHSFIIKCFVTKIADISCTYLLRCARDISSNDRVNQGRLSGAHICGNNNFFLLLSNKKRICPILLNDRFHFSELSGYLSSFPVQSFDQLINLLSFFIECLTLHDFEQYDSNFISIQNHCKIANDQVHIHTFVFSRQSSQCIIYTLECFCMNNLLFFRN